MPFLIAEAVGVWQAQRNLSNELEKGGKPTLWLFTLLMPIISMACFSGVNRCRRGVRWLNN